MAHVTVSIAGRSYRMACDAGEEKRLSALAERFDAMIDGLRGDFGEIGDRRLAVMAGISLLDTVEEQRHRLAALEAELGTMRNDRDDIKRAHQAAERTHATAIREATEAINALTAQLSAPAEDADNG